LELADRAWDNVGLLLENAEIPDLPSKKTVLLTIDLTPDVAEEAIEKGASVIVTYRGHSCS
jgi:putative NIF3 family GTP cyclohydrolase 1 type 2